MKIRGVNYDVGTEYRPGESSRPLWSEADVSRDLRVIRQELYCTSVNIYGTALDRLVVAARLAHEEGLHVSLQLRSIDESREEMLARVAGAARGATRLLASGGVTLNVGCEATLFTRGFVPGATFMKRIRNLLFILPFLPYVNHRLNRHLAEAVRLARQEFDGAITYSAGAWESVCWERFDLVGVNLYRDRWNERTYTNDLRALRKFDRPVVITEFGCSTFEGAERRGGGGWMIIDFDRQPPVVKRGYVRSEAVQAAHIGELLALFEAEGIDGAYVFDFIQSALSHSSDPSKDLDMAGYGLVRVPPAIPGEASMTWVRKAAFHTVARRYQTLRQ